MQVTTYVQSLSWLLFNTFQFLYLLSKNKIQTLIKKKAITTNHYIMEASSSDKQTRDKKKNDSKALLDFLETDSSELNNVLEVTKLTYNIHPTSISSKLTDYWTVTNTTLYNELKNYKIVLNSANNFDDWFYTFNNGLTCFKSGTDYNRIKHNSSLCTCISGYYGTQCAHPAIIWEAIQHYPVSPELITMRSKPKRIIHGIIFNHEFDMLEARFYSLNTTVDVFVILESTFSSYGEKKPLRFFEKFQKNDFLKEFRKKIIYIPTKYFPKLARNNGWVNELSLRYLLGKFGLSRVKNLKNEDLFVLSDADELPDSKVLAFLMFHDGYPEPINLAYKWNVFGFFWQQLTERGRPATSIVQSISSVGFVRKVLLNNLYFLRDSKMLLNKYVMRNLWQYRLDGNMVAPWRIGSNRIYAGWHCSWCFK